MRKLLHLVVLILIINIPVSNSNVLNRFSAKITANNKDIIINRIKLNEKSSITCRVAPFIKQGVLFAPVADLKPVIDFDDKFWDPNSRSLTIYKEEPMLVVDDATIPYDGTAEEKLIELIQQAKKSIEIQMYRFQNDQIIKELYKRKLENNGIAVRILLDKADGNCRVGIINPGETIEKSLENIHCIVKWKKSKQIMHRKVAVFDNETFYLGSGNWTENGLTGKNWELGLIWRNKDIAEKISSEFHGIWGDDNKESQMSDLDYNCGN